MSDNRMPDNRGGADPDLESTTTGTAPDDVEAQRASAVEADDDAVEPEAEPESQGDDPLTARYGAEGQGDLAPEDL